MKSTEKVGSGDPEFYRTLFMLQLLTPSSTTAKYFQEIVVKENDAIHSPPFRQNLSKMDMANFTCEHQRDSITSSKEKCVITYKIFNFTQNARD